MEANLNLLRMDLMDMHWALLGSWRDLLTTIFDRPEKVQLLKNCKSVQIAYNSIKTASIKHPDLRSIYLQAWLASRLGARFRKAEFLGQNLLISYFGEENPLVVALEPRIDKQYYPGTILELIMTFTSGDSYSITPKPAVSQALIHEESALTCALPYTLPLPNVFSGITFLNELLYQNVGEHYRKMLRMISHLQF